MNEFDDIRPYNDDEVRPALNRVLATAEFQRALARLSFPRLAKVCPGLVGRLVAWYTRRQLREVQTVKDLQLVVQGYMETMMGRTMHSLTSSGLDQLDTHKAYLFVSNHRDIALDPALLDWVLHTNGFDTARLAIGDNLLTMPYASDLMRLNKSFIVKRSAKGNKEKFRALKHLSAYVYHSVVVEKSNLWIAQRQGRAKNGWDRTESAVIKMFAMNKPKEQAFADYIRELNIVPVAISYEWDPLDEHKARELYEQEHHGHYQKAEHEDVVNIARGIDGFKGHVHLAFGEPLTRDYQSPDELVADIDRHIIENYVLQPSNCLAYKALYGYLPAVRVGNERKPFVEDHYRSEARQMTERLRLMDPKYRSYVRHMYANPIVSKQALQMLEPAPVAAQL